MKSLRRYRDHVDVKRRVDALQSDLQCCGDRKYTDWFRVAWVPDEFVDIRYTHPLPRCSSQCFHTRDEIVPKIVINDSTRKLLWFEITKTPIAV